MVNVVSNDQAKQFGSSSWCAKWFGSQKDFIAGNVRESVPLKRLAGLENLYAVGPLENARGEISIFNSVPLISQVRDRGLTIVTGLSYRAGFLAFAIVENWCKLAILQPADDSQNNSCHWLFQMESTSTGRSRFYYTRRSNGPPCMSCAIKVMKSTARSYTRKPRSVL